MKNIYLLPTDKPSRLWLTWEEKLGLHPTITNTLLDKQHIYITNDEEIKEDWMYNIVNNTINKCWEIYRWDEEYNKEKVDQLMLDNPKDKKRGWGFLKRSEAKKSS